MQGSKDKIDKINKRVLVMEKGKLISDIQKGKYNL